MGRLMQAWESLDDRLPRVAQTLDLHHIAGYSIDSVATILGLSLQASARDLRFGNAWLVRALDRHLRVVGSSSQRDPVRITQASR